VKLHIKIRAGAKAIALLPEAAHKADPVEERTAQAQAAAKAAPGKKLVYKTGFFIG
jgi:hypothetical protein